MNIRNLVVFILIEKFSQSFLERYPAGDSLSPPGKKHNRVKNDLKLLKKGEVKKPFSPVSLFNVVAIQKLIMYIYMSQRTIWIDFGFYALRINILLLVPLLLELVSYFSKSPISVDGYC